jgi:hypothetical protein
MGDCSLVFRFPGEEKAATLADLRQLCESDPSLSLAAKLRGASMRVDWPHTRPPPTGAVRAQLIHARMHRSTAPASWREDRPAQGLTRLSAIFTLLITIPAVAFTVYSICRWLEVEETKSKVIGLVLGLASFFVELGLIIVHAWKDEKLQDRAVKRGPPRTRYR